MKSSSFFVCLFFSQKIRTFPALSFLRNLMFFILATESCAFTATDRFIRLIDFVDPINQERMISHPQSKCRNE